MPFAAQDVDQEAIAAAQVHKGLPGGLSPFGSLFFPEDQQVGSNSYIFIYKLLRVSDFRPHLDHGLVLLFQRLVSHAVLHDGDEGQGAFEATLPALHTPPGQPGQQLFSKPAGFGIHSAI